MKKEKEKEEKTRLGHPSPLYNLKWFWCIFRFSSAFFSRPFFESQGNPTSFSISLLRIPLHLIRHWSFCFPYHLYIAWPALICFLFFLLLKVCPLSLSIFLWFLPFWEFICRILDFIFIFIFYFNSDLVFVNYHVLISDWFLQEIWFMKCLTRFFGISISVGKS